MATPPEWLRELADAVAALIEPAELLAPLGCHYHCADEIWEITIFASSTEVVGGPQDGVIRKSRFTVDLARLFEIFSEVGSFHWQALSFGSPDQLGPHISLEGMYAGRQVWLRLLSSPPKGYPSGRMALVNEMAWKNVW